MGANDRGATRLNQSDYLAHDSVGLADLIARREVSALDVIEAAAARLEAVNPRLNAVTLETVDQARATVKDGAPPGPLGGVPYLIKDLGAQVAGLPTTAGSWLMGDPPAAADSAIVAAYRKGGLVILGKTNTPEFGLEPVTEPARFGPSRNPWICRGPQAVLPAARPPRSQAASRPPLTPATEAVRSARRPPAAAFLASSPRAGGCRSRRRMKGGAASPSSMP